MNRPYANVRLSRAASLLPPIRLEPLRRGSWSNNASLQLREPRQRVAPESLCFVDWTTCRAGHASFKCERYRVRHTDAVHEFGARHTHTCRRLDESNGSRSKLPNRDSSPSPRLSSNNTNSCGKITRSRYSTVRTSTPRSTKCQRIVRTCSAESYVEVSSMDRPPRCIT